MAVLSDYSVGTLSVVNGTSVVTGVGTAWNLQSFQEGDIVLVDNLAAIIAGPPTSSTSIPITRPWTGETKTNVPYRIRYMADGSRYTAIGQALVNLLGDGLLAAVSAAGGGIDKLAYYTGAATVALTGIRAKGRSVLDSDTTLNLLPKLGPVFGGPAPTPTNADVGMTDGNFDDLIYPGLYTVGGAWTNGPLGAASNTYVGVIEVLARTSGFYVQTLRRTNGYVYRRWTTGATWPNAWEAIENPTIGTVANANGFPVGGIIERGSNANGEYVRYADGTQICWVRNISITANVAFTWTYPIAFSAVSVVNGTSTAASSPRVFSGLGQLSSATGNLWTSSTAAEVTGGVNLTAIGRWF